MEAKRLSNTRGQILAAFLLWSTLDLFGAPLQGPRPAERRLAPEPQTMTRPAVGRTGGNADYAVNLKEPRVLGVSPYAASSQAWVEMRPGTNAAFGEVQPGTDYQLPSGVAVQVFSPGDWELQLVVPPHLEVADLRRTVPFSRLLWRAGDSGPFLPLPGGGAVTVARGPGTGPAGRLVVLQLMLRLENQDPLGNYKSHLSFRVQQKVR